MGRALIDAPERWRPWAHAGLSSILGPLPWVDAFAAERGGEGEPELADFKARAGDKGFLSRESSQAGGGGASQPEALPASRAGEGSFSAFGASPEAPGPVPAPGAFASLAAEPMQRPMPVDFWPEAWRAAWRKTAFARPFLWSYERLGEDLLGTPSPERREVLRNLLSQLALGPVHNFWPFSEPDEAGGLRLQPELFQEGLKYLAPHCVIFFGRDEFAGVTLPEIPEPYKVVSYRGTGVLCVHLPDIHALGNDPGLLAEAVAAIKQKLVHLI